MGTTDFTDFALSFTRFTITHARMSVLPYISSYVNVAGTAYVIAGPMALGYFNDQVAVANPSSYSSVLADEQSRIVSPYATKDTDS